MTIHFTLEFGVKIDKNYKKNFKLYSPFVRTGLTDTSQGYVPLLGSGLFPLLLELNA